MTSADPDDEITLDPEVTSAADGRWIVELRKQARASNRSVADILGDDDTTEPSEQPDRSAHAPARFEPTDEEITIDYSAASAMRPAPRPAAPASPPPPGHRPPPPTALPSRIPDAVTPPRSSSDASLRSSPPPSHSTPPPTRSHDRAAASPASPRWEPPPRLSTGAVGTPRALLSQPTDSRSRFAPLVAVLAVLLAVILAVLVWVIVTDTDEPVSPDGSVVPTESSVEPLPEIEEP